MARNFVQYPADRLACTRRIEGGKAPAIPLIMLLLVVSSGDLIVVEVAIIIDQ